MDKVEKKKLTFGQKVMFAVLALGTGVAIYDHITDIKAGAGKAADWTKKTYNDVKARVQKH